jgi:hypothetical protein
MSLGVRLAAAGCRGPGDRARASAALPSAHLRSVSRARGQPAIGAAAPVRAVSTAVVAFLTGADVNLQVTAAREGTVKVAAGAFATVVAGFARIHYTVAARLAGSAVGTAAVAPDSVAIVASLPGIDFTVAADRTWSVVRWARDFALGCRGPWFASDAGSRCNVRWVHNGEKLIDVADDRCARGSMRFEPRASLGRELLSRPDEAAAQNTGNREQGRDDSSVRFGQVGNACRPLHGCTGAGGGCEVGVARKGAIPALGVGAPFSNKSMPPSSFPSRVLSSVSVLICSTRNWTTSFLDVFRVFQT